MGRIYNGPDWAPARPAVVRPGITTFRVVGLALGCLILAMSGESRVSAQTDESKVLALPLSAGAIASLVEYTNSEAAQARLAEALTSSLSGLRAAAARVLFVTARHSLLPAVSTALDRETDVDALAEEARALAWFGGPDADAHVLAAWQRVPADRAVLAIAAARGTAALEHLPLIRERTSDETLLAAICASPVGRIPTA